MLNFLWSKRRSPFLALFVLAITTTTLTILYTPLSFITSLFDKRYSPKPSDSPAFKGNGIFVIRGQRHPDLTLEHLGVLSARKSEDWSALECSRRRKLRSVSIRASEGKLTFYVYNSKSDDTTATQRALRGLYFEKKEIGEFLRVSRDLPLIDVGANLGLVTLQAAMQGREVVAVEPVAENALRLCRSVLDFGHAPLVHVIQNAVSSREGNVTLAMVAQKARTQYEVRDSNTSGYGATTAYAIWLDRLLDVLPFTKAALKIDVEGHEGHVLAGAERMFQEVDIPLVWMEWVHVKGRGDPHGGLFVLDFMHRHQMDPYHLMTGQPLSGATFMDWPFSVLWRARQKNKRDPS
ncbi:hypothetical protein ACOMHN_065867 [Nucella lapillus]